MRHFTDMRLDRVAVNSHQALIELAEDGHIQAAQILMSDAAVYMQHQKQLPEPLGSYIGEALKKAAVFDTEWGCDANEAFHLKRRRGRDRYLEDSKTHLICMEVQRAWFTVERYLSSNRGPGAYEIVAEAYGYKDVDSVRKRFEANHTRWSIKEQTQTALDEQLKLFRRLYAS